MEPIRRIERSPVHPPVAAVPRLPRLRREDQRQGDPREDEREDGREGRRPAPGPDADGHLDVLA